MAKNKSKRRNLKKVLTLIVILLVIIFVLVCYFNPELYYKILNLIKGNELPTVDGEYVVVETLEDAEVHFIDVGQGDSILITLPDYKNVLIDAGDRDKEYNEHIIEYLNEHAHKKGLAGNITIDYFILTHPDADHAGGADEIFEAFEVKKTFRPYVKYKGDADTYSQDFNKGSYEHHTVTYSEFLSALRDEKYSTSQLQCEWEFFNYDSDFSGGAIYNDVKYTYQFDFLTPTTSVDKIYYKDINDYSPIIKFSYQGASVLLTGDAEKDAEEDFCTQYLLGDEYLDVDVLKVGHHGSETSSTQALLDRVKPEYAVISCGEGNKYGHPHQPTLNRLFALKCTLYRTDLHGDVVMVIEDDGEFNFVTDKDNPNVWQSGVRQ